MTDALDLIVIGAGMAGITAAKKCARAGWSVANVDELPYGGTCALRDCDPKKMLRAGAEAVEAARRLEGKGARGETRIDWPALIGQDYQPHVYNVSFDARGRVFIVGEFGLIARSDDGGQSWTSLHQGDASLFGFAFCASLLAFYHCCCYMIATVNATSSPTARPSPTRGSRRSAGA